MPRGWIPARCRRPRRTKRPRPAPENLRRLCYKAARSSRLFCCAAERAGTWGSPQARAFHCRNGKPISLLLQEIPRMPLPRFLALILPVLLLAAQPAAGQERRVPGSPAELKLSYAPVVQKAAPAVVNVYAAKVVENRNPFFDDPFFRRFFGGEGGLPRERRQSSLGSGVIVDPAGLVITNNHVIEGADEVKVALADKREFEAEIVLKDARTDLAVLRIKDSHERFPVIELGDSDGLQVGDVVLAIGNPFAVGQTVT